ncbi:hypothetical protein [Actinomycetospora aeridis]|uniref:DUF4386 family protein n=1 Tax=Actinomycetospora aeridis TaxID=3129231 RepID=A0ABU8N9J7_9PSEU
MSNVEAPPAPASTGRWIPAGLVLAVVATIVPTAVHGNPPIESAELTLRWIAERPSWRPVHLLAVAAIVLWAACLNALARGAGPRPAGDVGRVAALTMTVATAVFAVYFGLHAWLAVPAAELVAGAVPAALVVERTAAAMIVLGAVAFTAQALLGAAIALHGLTLALDRRFPRWLGPVGLAAGLGWLTGAVIVDFAVIVPFTAAAWLWSLVLAGVCWSRRRS